MEKTFLVLLLLLAVLSSIGRIRPVVSFCLYLFKDIEFNRWSLWVYLGVITLTTVLSILPKILKN